MEICITGNGNCLCNPSDRAVHLHCSSCTDLSIKMRFLVVFSIAVLAVLKAVGMAEVSVPARGRIYSTSMQLDRAKLRYGTAC